MSRFREIFRDEFADSSLGIPSDAGNGSFAETTRLRVSCPLGVNCEWFSASKNSPVAYVELMPPGRVYRAEARLVAVAASANNIFPGIAVWQDRDNAYLNGWNNVNNNIALDRQLDGVGAGLYSALAVDPNVTAHRPRVYWNAGSVPAVLPEADEFVLHPNTICWYRTLDDGATYTRVHTRTLEFEIRRAGVYAYNYSPFPSVDADFDYLSISAADLPLESEEPVVVEDVARFVDAGGPRDHAKGFSAGRLIPGPAEQPVGSVGPFPSGSAEDEIVALDLGNEAGQHELSVGGSLEQDPGTRGSVEDEFVAFELGNEDAPSRELSAGELGVDPGTGGSAEELETRRPGAEAEFNPYVPTLDGEAHAHLTNLNAPCRRMRILDLTRGDWADPLNTNFTGYAKDGHSYVSGVLQGGGPHAPWATESASADRSSRADAPDRVLCVIAYQSVSNWEIVWYDLDGYPGTLDVWMRWKPHNDYSFVGNLTQAPLDVDFFDGVFALVLTTSVGRLHLIDFKSDDQDVAFLIGTDDHWIAPVGKTIVDRNSAILWTTALGGRPELRIQSEWPDSVRMYAEGTKLWTVVAGEDGATTIESLHSTAAGSVPQFDYDLVQLNVPANVGNIRHVEIGTDGWLWIAVQNRIIRNVSDWRGGVLVDGGPESVGHVSGVSRRRHAFAELGADVVPPTGASTPLAATRNWVFAATELGIYRVNKTTLEVSLAYTIAGGGGGGYLDVPGDGELLPGDNPVVQSIGVVTAKFASYLVVAMTSWGGGVVVIRLVDDKVVHSREYPALTETGALVARMVI